MQSIIDSIWNMLSSLFNWLLSIFSSIWTSTTTFFQDLLFDIYDGFLTLFETMITAIPVPAVWSNVNPLGSVPAQTIYLLWKCGVLQCLLIIGAAYGVRFLLNLIPGAFTRV